jgi:hypothetical protein
MRFTAFAERLLGVEFFPAQKVCFEVLYDGVEPGRFEGERLALARRMFGENVETIPPEARRVAVMVKGGRVMGTRGAAIRMCHLGATVAAPPTAPGEPLFALMVGPDLRLARQALDFALGAMRSNPDLAERVQGETRESFEFVRDDGRRVIYAALPATAGGSAVRGRTLIGAVMTEASFFRDAMSVVNDADIFRALLPRIVPGGQLVIESTPWAELGLLWQLWERDFGKPTGAMVAHCPTLLMRPDPEVARLVALERARDPDSAAQEFDAEFRAAGSSAFFDPHLIDDAVTEYEFPLPHDPSCGRACAADLGFRLDSSALCILQNRQTGATLAYVDEIQPTLGNPLVPSIVLSRFTRAILNYGGSHCFFDQTYIESVKELCWQVGISANDLPHGQPGKLEMHMATREMFAEKRIRIPKHARLIAQLKAIMVKPTPGGGLQITTPRRRGMGHGDVASAFVGVAWAVRTSNAGERARFQLREHSKRLEAVGAILVGSEALVDPSVDDGRMDLILARRAWRESGGEDRERAAWDQHLRASGSPAWSGYQPPAEPTAEEQAAAEALHFRVTERLKKAGNE